MYVFTIKCTMLGTWWKQGGYKKYHSYTFIFIYTVISMYVCHFSAFLSWNCCSVKIIILVIHGDETGIEEEVNVDGKIFKVCKMESFCSNNFGYKKKVTRYLLTFLILIKIGFLSLPCKAVLWYLYWLSLY